MLFSRLVPLHDLHCLYLRPEIFTLVTQCLRGLLSNLDIRSGLDLGPVVTLLSLPGDLGNACLKNVSQEETPNHYSGSSHPPTSSSPGLSRATAERKEPQTNLNIFHGSSIPWHAGIFLPCKPTCASSLQLKTKSL